MSTGALIDRPLFGPGKALLIGLSAALLFALLVPAGALARSFAPDLQVSPDPNTANQAPQLVQGLTRQPLVLLCDSNNPPPTTDCGEQAIKQLSFKLPRSWRVNGEALVETCNLSPSDPTKDDKLTPIDPSLCPPSGQVGTVDANIQVKICGLICALGLDPLTITVGASGKVYYVNSYQYYNNPELGNRQDWAQTALASGDANGNSLPVILAIQIQGLSLPPPLDTLLSFPPFYLDSYLSRDSFRIQNDLTPDAEMFGANSAWMNTGIVQSMNLTLNSSKTEAAGLFRTPPEDACSADQVWDYSATSYADTVAGGPPGPGNPSPPLDAAQNYPDEGTLPITSPTLTGCGTNNDAFDSPKISNIGTTTTDAGANPDLTISMTRDSGDSFLKGLKMTLPEGMVGSPFATLELCSEQQAQQNQCPAGSKVGTADTEVSVFDTRHINIHANVYQAPTAGSEQARFLAVLNTPPIGDEQTVVLPTTLRILPGAKGIVAELPSMPTEFDARKVSFTFNGSTGADRQHPLLINPTACNPVDIKVDFTSEVGQTHTATAPYQATNCDKLPYDPKLDVTLTCNSPHCQPGISATITQAYGEATTSATKLTIPSSFTLNTQNKTQLCSRSDLASETCPASSQMGTAVIESPLANDPLQGQVFLAEPPTGATDVVRTIHAHVSGLIDMSVDADLKSNPKGGFDTVMSGLPQVPIGKLQLNFNGGQNGLVNAPFGCGAHEFKAEFASHSGRQVSKTGNVEIAGTECAPKMSASVSPTKAGARSKLTLNVRPNQGTVLKSAKFNLGSLRVRGLGRSRSARKLGSLKLTPKSGRGTLSTRKTKMSLGKNSLSLKGLPNQALRELNLVFNSKRTKALRNPKKCGKVRIVGRFVDTKNQAYKTTAKLRISCAKKRK